MISLILLIHPFKKLFIIFLIFAKNIYNILVYFQNLSALKVVFSIILMKLYLNIIIAFICIVLLAVICVLIALYLRRRTLRLNDTNQQTKNGVFVLESS